MRTTSKLYTMTANIIDYCGARRVIFFFFCITLKPRVEG